MLYNKKYNSFTNISGFFSSIYTKGENKGGIYLNDQQIIHLYLSRTEQAIKETKNKYSSFCRKIAFNILANNEDTDECENDTYLKIWNSIPPNKPASLKAYIGRITRNIAIDLWKKNHTRKRNAGIEILFSELEDVISSTSQTENEYELAELTSVINNWLSTLSRQEQSLFVLRYWQGESVKNISEQWNTSPSKLSGKLFRLRQSLKSTLEKEGIFL